MNVSPNSNSGSVGRIFGKAAPATPATPAPDTAHFAQAAALNAALADTPEVRAGEVERARALIRDANYPAATTIRSIANLLARHLEDEPSDN
ncbi:MAG: hypothetical protein RL514_663 [Verrucomicrobiota bacterium]|jgi:hypothetical protein